MKRGYITTIQRQRHTENNGFLKANAPWKGEDSEKSWQGNGHGLLGHTRNHLHQLLGKGKTITGDYFVLIALVDRQNQEKPSIPKEKIVFYQDWHTCAEPRAKIIELKFELSQHPITNSGKWLGRQQFTSNE